MSMGSRDTRSMKRFVHRYTPDQSFLIARLRPHLLALLGWRFH